ncbi:hypothetical protein VFPPC_16021 [Pochonia chlamydosporia 170]|uniref:Uncharacterized protein n=1 Tax=Pochonia chlamydosporia 170 TaxID=1380566 RepID=A0A179FL92_METCM|nr:hypothetical protein VFPPC_16021 [Pochonia chlamydosporia 170]OAQ66406.1 hypothetical protein VFPPC_16021 [Pochonia chlamydosporia 170]
MAQSISAEMVYWWDPEIWSLDLCCAMCACLYFRPDCFARGAPNKQGNGKNFPSKIGRDSGPPLLRTLAVVTAGWRQAFGCQAVLIKAMALESLAAAGQSRQPKLQNDAGTVYCGADETESLLPVSFSAGNFVMFYRG